MRTGEDNWGPWAVGIDRAERLARVRSLRALSHAFYGIEHPLVVALFRAESLKEPDLERAHDALKTTPSRDMRKIVNTYLSMATMKIRERAAQDNPFQRQAS